MDIPHNMFSIILPLLQMFDLLGHKCHLAVDQRVDIKLKDYSTIKKTYGVKAELAIVENDLQFECSI